jgi:hypothetical protein
LRSEKIVEGSVGYQKRQFVPLQLELQFDALQHVCIPRIGNIESPSFRREKLDSKNSLGHLLVPARIDGSRAEGSYNKISEYWRGCENIAVKLISLFFSALMMQMPVGEIFLTS